MGGRARVSKKVFVWRKIQGICGKPTKLNAETYRPLQHAAVSWVDISMSLPVATHCLSSKLSVDPNAQQDPQEPDFSVEGSMIQMFFKKKKECEGRGGGGGGGGGEEAGKKKGRREKYSREANELNAETYFGPVLC